MSIFNVGDVVKIKDGLEIYKKYGYFNYTKTRNNFKGKTLKIKNVFNNYVIGRQSIEPFYYCFENYLNDMFTSEMLEFAVILSKKERDIKIKQIVKEIKANKDYSECFDNVEKEVNTWDDIKVEQW